MEKTAIEEPNYDDFWKEFAESENKRLANNERINNRLLQAIKSIRGEKFVECLLNSLDDLNVDMPFELVKSPTGKYQRHSDFGNTLQGEWVDQWAVGDSGDSWSGYIYIKLKKNKYLKITYSC